MSIHIPVKRGSRHPLAIFSPEEVEEMRRRHMVDGVSGRALAKEKGCHYETVNRVLRHSSYEDD